MAAGARTVAFLLPAYHVNPWPSPFVERMNACFGSLRAVHELEPVLIWVDDGSTRPGTELGAHRATLSRLQCRVLAARHPINRGQGAAIQTALELARSPGVNAAYFVTFDSDGQHDPADVPGVLGSLRERSLNIVFGNRFQAARRGGTGIPALRKFLILAATAFERALTGLALTDAHNGLRAFDRKAASAIELTQDRMAHATEFKTIVSRTGLRYGEAPVLITYSEESLSAGQRNSDAARILVQLVRGWWFR